MSQGVRKLCLDVEKKYRRAEFPNQESVKLEDLFLQSKTVLQFLIYEHLPHHQSVLIWVHRVAGQR